jgi:DNA-binding Lrp family transcriptional regulator
MRKLDSVDARLLLALIENPDATTVALAAQIGAARNTVQARLAQLTRRGVIGSFGHRIDPAAIGYPLTAFITIQVVQRELAAVSAAMSDIPEIIEVHGISGEDDLLARAVARDAEHLYEVAGRVLGTPGVERTRTALVMRDLVNHRISPLLDRLT